MSLEAETPNLDVYEQRHEATAKAIVLNAEGWSRPDVAAMVSNFLINTEAEAIDGKLKPSEAGEPYSHEEIVDAYIKFRDRAKIAISHKDAAGITEALAELPTSGHLREAIDSFLKSPNTAYPLFDAIEMLEQRVEAERAVQEAELGEVAVEETTRTIPGPETAVNGESVSSYDSLFDDTDGSELSVEAAAVRSESEDPLTLARRKSDADFLAQQAYDRRKAGLN